MPPDSSDTNCAGLELRMRMASIWRCASFASSPLLTNPPLEISGMLPKAMLALIDWLSSRPSPLRSSVIRAMPLRTASTGERMLTVFAGEPSATVPLSAPKATPFDMRVLNRLDRFNLVMSAVYNLPQLGNSGSYLIQQMKDKLVEHKQYIARYGVDLPEVANWKWTDK